jgi:mRNA interferase MazF
MAGGSGYAGKPRPVLIVQDDAFAERDSVTMCLISSDPTDLLNPGRGGLRRGCGLAAVAGGEPKKSRLE